MKKSLGAKDLIFPAPVLIVGTYDEDGVPNAMNVAWGGLCSSNPPAVAISIRKERKTYQNITARKAFTVNVANEAVMAGADYVGMVSGNKVHKFDHVDLTPVKAPNVDAPYIEEFPVSLECRVMHIMEVGSHIHIIGEIVNVLADESVLNEKNSIDVGLLKAIGYDPAGNQYVAASQVVGKAFSEGMALMKKAEGR